MNTTKSSSTPKAFLLFLSFLLVNILANGQSLTNSKIKGLVVDQNTNAPIEYAVIAVINTQTQKVVNGTTSNEKGIFEVDVPYGTYQLSVDFMGYSPIKTDSVTTNNTHSMIDLGKISLSGKSYTLQSVVITSHSSVVVNKADRVIYNVANDITSQGGVAIDILKKVPQVTVDVDGNVELQGNSNIRFLINGKPSSMFGNSLSDALASIPASQIKSIEAITTPGAKYEADGTGGIINIILKDNSDNNLHGISGNINLTGGTRLENGTFNLNIKQNKFAINAFFNGNSNLGSRTSYTQNRNSTDVTTNTTTQLLQNGYNDFTRNSYRTGIGMDWDFTANDNLSASVSLNHFANHINGLTDQQSFSLNDPLNDIYSFRNSNSQSKNNAIDANIDYTKKFRKKGETLELLYNSSYANPYNNYLQSQTYSERLTPYSGSSSNNSGKDRQTRISLDYTYPINDNFQLETGAKTTIQDISSNTQVNVLHSSTGSYIYDPAQSDNFQYKLKIYACYISGDFHLFNFLNVKAGLRYEYTKVEVNFPNTIIPSYGTLVPSVILSHKLSEDQTIKLAYTRRIQRPGYQALNPFMNLSDPYNITTGNPLLKPEVGNNIEMGYEKTFNNGGNIYLALMERINTNDVKTYTQFYPTYTIGDSIYSNVSVTSRQNVGKEYNTGLIISGSMPITERLNFRENLMVFNRHDINELNSGAVTNSLNWRFNMNGSYQFNHNLIAEGFINYISAFKNVQGMQAKQLTYTLALRKQFWNKKASLGITATDPFNQYINQVTTVATSNYNSYYLRRVPYRSVGINFTYNFGKQDFKKDKESNE